MALIAGSGRALGKQIVLPWSKALSIAVDSLRVRFGRSVITSISIILATAFLAFIRSNHDYLESLGALQDPDVNFLLQKRGIDIEGQDPGLGARDKWILTTSFLVCLVGVSNALLMSVSERIKEIGTMKCLGALNSFIVKLFMLEALVLGTASSLMGAMIGIASCFATNLASFHSAAVKALPLGGLLEAAAITCLVGTALSVLAAIYPSLLAARMQPVEAMRSEV